MIDFDRIEKGNKIELTLEEYKELKDCYENMDSVYVQHSNRCYGDKKYEVITKDDFLKEIGNVNIKLYDEVFKLKKINDFSVKEFKQYKKGK